MMKSGYADDIVQNKHEIILSFVSFTEHTAKALQLTKTNCKLIFKEANKQEKALKVSNIASRSHTAAKLRG